MTYAIFASFAAVGLAVPQGAHAASPGQARGAVLLVNDEDAVGTVGDDRLAFGEALALANGSLAVDRLSAAERRQVRGTPGAARRDSIRFKLPGGVVRFPLQVQKKPDMDFAVLLTSSKLAPLTGNDGDEIRGGGIRFANGPDDAVDAVNESPLFAGAPIGGAGLVIESSHFTLSGVVFDRFVQPLLFRPAAGGAALQGVTLTGNSFRNSGGVSFSAMASRGGRGALRDILIEKNKFLGPALFGEVYPSKLHNAIAITGAAGAAAKEGEPATVVVDNVRIVRNKVREYAGGVQVQPLQTLFAKNRGAELTRLVISRNDISLGADAGDPAVYLWGAVAVNGEVADVRVDDVLVEKNRIVGNGHVLFLSGVEALLGGTVPATNVHLSNIQIRGNRISPRSQCSFGITALAAFPEMNGPVANGNSLHNVVIADNRIKDCVIGAFASPVLNVGAPGTSSGNVIDGLSIRTNRISGAKSGVVVAGGAIIASEFAGEIGIEKNAVRRLEIVGNTVEADDVSILVAGAFVRGGVKADISGNIVDVARIAGNVGSAPAACRAESEVVEGAVARLAGNGVSGAQPHCGRRAAAP